MKNRFRKVLFLGLGMATLAIVGVAQQAGADWMPAPEAVIRMPFVPGSSASGASSPSGKKHPGEITYSDKIEGRTYKREAAQVPSSMAWVQVGEDWKAVVRIEISGSPDRRTVIKFGADGAVLETTVHKPPVGPLPPT